MQNYNRWTVPAKSYLVPADDGYMRVQGGSTVTVVRYDADFKVLSRTSLPQELPIFGGFYDDGKSYYLVTGQSNADQDNDREVFRVTKYRKDWSRVGSCGLRGANTTVPFDAGSCRMDSTGKYLVVRTCHEMYKSSDGYNHQANVTMLIDTEAMSVLDSFTGVMNTSYGYVSHSFNQFVKLENNKIVAVDHGDAYPRGICLMQYPVDVTSGKFQSGNVKTTMVMSFIGDAGDNTTGASVGGFEISGSSYLIAGNSIDQSAGNLSATTRNAFVASVDKSTLKVTVHWLTNYATGEGTVSTPQLSKVSDNRYLVLWHRGTSVCYVFVDGSGNALGDVQTFEGELSDCAPVLVGQHIAWYTWDNARETLYRIPTDPSDSVDVKAREYGHQHEWMGTEGGLATFRCKTCGDTYSAKVPTGFSIYWRDTASTSSYYWSNVPTGLTKGSSMAYLFSGVSYSATADSTRGEFTVESSDPAACAVDQGTKTITFNDGGEFTITVYPTYNPNMKRTYKVQVGKPLESVELQTDPASPAVYGGNPVVLTAVANGGKGALRYTFSCIDESGKQTILAEDAASATYNWKPTAAGSYRLKVIAVDAEDGNKAVTSEEVGFTVGKAEKPTCVPSAEYNLAYSVDRLSNDILLDATSWSFADADLGTSLVAGEQRTFTVVYGGEDAGNYRLESMQVKITRSTCEHAKTDQRNQKEATCTESGYSGDTYCAVCGACTKNGLSISPLGHSFTNYEPDGNATCTQDGTKTATCDRAGCGATDTQADKGSALGHSFTKYASNHDATCTQDGTKTATCDRAGCGATDTQADKGSMLEHNWDAGVVVEEPTCTEDGERIVTCRDCGERETQVIEPFGHRFGSWEIVSKATCEADGLQERTCAECGEGETRVIPATGHSWGSWVTVKEPTVSAAGERQRTCKNCDKTQRAEIAKLPEKPLPKKVPAMVSPKTPADAATVDKQILRAKSDADPRGSTFHLLRAKGAAASKSAVKLSWKKVSGAKAYVIYGNKCGKASKFKKLDTVKGTSFTHKKLRKGTYYKYLVVAVKGKAALAISKVIHVATDGGKAGNDKSVNTSAKKGELTLKKGAGFSLKAKAVPKSKKLKVVKHRAIAYDTSNPSVATVSSKGVIKAKGKGNCTVYAYAQDGACKAIKVKVK